MPRKKSTVAEVKKKGTKCSVCGQLRTPAIGYYYTSDDLYDMDDHTSVADCIQFLKVESDNGKLEIQDLKDRVKDLERASTDYSNYMA